MSKTSNTLFSFLLGAATGAVIGILYAPDKGSNTRDRLSYKLDKYRSMLESLLEDLADLKYSTMYTPDGYNLITFLYICNKFLLIFLLFLLRTKHEKIENYNHPDH